MIRIKNHSQLLKNLPSNVFRRRKILLKIAEDTLNDLQVEKLIARALNGKNVKSFKRVAVFAIGKAAKSMAVAVVKNLGRKPDLVLLADEGHPYPTKKGLQKTLKIMRAAESLGEKDLAIVLISGGGSAMFVAPVKEITLQEKIAVAKTLIKSGANINEINIVRKQLSDVKGGKLARLIYPATVWGLVISDVIGNDLSSIASGPIFPDRFLPQDALKIIKKYKIKASKRVMNYLMAASKKNDSKLRGLSAINDKKYFAKVKVKILADHNFVLRVAAANGKKMGLQVGVMEDFLQGEAREAAKKFVKNAQGKNHKKNLLIIAAGETTVTCKGKGYGGRNQEFVLAGLKNLEVGHTFLSVGTDGVDGVCPEKIAGAIGDESFKYKGEQPMLKNKKNAAQKFFLPGAKLDTQIDSYLADNDSYSFFKKNGGLIKTGPTGTNLGDLVLLI